MPAESAPSFSVQGRTVQLSGGWRLHAIQDLPLSGLNPLRGGEVTFDLSRLESIDTGSASLLLGAIPESNVVLQHANPELVRIFELVRALPIKSGPLKRAPRKFLGALGEAIVTGSQSFRTLLSFLGQTTIGQLQLLRSPRSIRLKELFVQLEQCALTSVPVVSLVMFLIGIVIAYLFAGQIERYGANIFIVDGVSIAICRELSPVIVAIIVAGRSGSAFTAQLGTMKLNEEVDALVTMGLSVMRVLILPRFLALIVALPILVAIGDVIGIIGGVVIAQFRLGIEVSTFVQRLHDILKVKHVLVGLVKAPVFAGFIAVIGCKMGLTVENNARSIGLHTTSTVVQGIVSVILLNAGFAVLFMELGI